MNSRTYAETTSIKLRAQSPLSRNIKESNRFLLMMQFLESCSAAVSAKIRQLSVFIRVKALIFRCLISGPATTGC